MNNGWQLITESLIMGVMVVVVGIIWGFILSRFRRNGEWYSKYMLVLWLFLIGITVHLLSEVTGLNKWYCRNGVACKKIST